MVATTTNPPTISAHTGPPALVRLPNELLGMICSWLPIHNIRVLGHVNHRLQNLVIDHLRAYQYDSGLFRLPETVLLKIARKLPLKDYSRFARTTQKLYPFLTKALVLDDTAHDLARSLVYAVRKNDMRFARKIISLGVDVNNPGSGSMLDRWGHTQLIQCRPLAFAALDGNEAAVRWLLQAGAQPCMDNWLCPLSGAISGLKYGPRSHHEYEKIARILLQNQTMGNQQSLERSYLLKACEARMVNLVRDLLRHQSEGPGFEEIQFDRSLVLRQLLDRRDIYVPPRNVVMFEDWAEIITLLLDHGAYPLTANHWSLTTDPTSFLVLRRGVPFSPSFRPHPLMFADSSPRSYNRYKPQFP